MTRMNLPTPARRASRWLGLLVGGAGLGLAAGGCSDAEAGALLGAGLGALAGQAIGNDTEATVIGTAIGAGVGYAVGNESDKRKSDWRYDRRTYDY
jgi:DNA mismatch repair protein MutH